MRFGDIRLALPRRSSAREHPLATGAPRYRVDEGDRPAETVAADALAAVLPHLG